MAGLRALATEHGRTPSMFDMREALRLARQFRDEGMSPQEAARCAGTLAFNLYGEAPPWQGH